MILFYDLVLRRCLVVGAKKKAEGRKGEGYGVRGAVRPKDYARVQARRQKALRQAFVKVLMRSPVKQVAFSGNFRKISLTFFGERISHRIVIKREKYIGAWSRRRDEIDVDKNVYSRDHMKSFKALCVHEAVEKYVADKFGLHENTEAHQVATLKEKQYLRSIRGNWRSHELFVFHVWSAINQH
jgi:hypothetical protein